MNHAIVEIFQKTKNLTLEARSELILGLIDEADMTNDSEITQAWIAEAEFRHQEIRAGRRKTVTHEELKKKLNWI